MLTREQEAAIERLSLQHNGVSLEIHNEHEDGHAVAIVVGTKISYYISRWGDVTERNPSKAGL